MDWKNIKPAQYFLACLQEVHQCQQCGKCCRGMNGIALTRLDTQKMAKHLGMSEKEFRQKYTTPSPRKPSDRLYKLEGPENRCPFQGESGGCTQYEGRGQVCRFYPWASPENMGNVAKGKNFMIYDRCKGMLITYINVLEDSKFMPAAMADALLKSDSGRLMFLRVVDMEGRGEAYIKKRLKELGLDDWPPNDVMYAMAYQYAVAYCTKLTTEKRDGILGELNDLLNRGH